MKPGPHQYARWHWSSCLIQPLSNWFEMLTNVAQKYVSQSYITMTTTSAIAAVKSNTALLLCARHYSKCITYFNNLCDHCIPVVSKFSFTWESLGALKNKKQTKKHTIDSGPHSLNLIFLGLSILAFLNHDYQVEDSFITKHICPLRKFKMHSLFNYQSSFSWHLLTFWERILKTSLGNSGLILFNKCLWKT